MNDQERIKEIAIKHLKQCPEKYYIEQNCLTIPEPTVEWMMQAIIEATKDLSATIEAQKKEIEELMKDKERLDFYCLHRHLVASRISIIEANCGRGFNENFLNIRVAIDSAISKQRNEL